MRDMAKVILARVLSLTMVFSVMVGLNLPAYAAELPDVDVYSIAVSTNSTDSSGGDVTVTVNSLDWPADEGIVYYTMTNKTTGDTVIDLTTATVSQSSPSFTVAIPENPTSAEVQYLIKVNGTTNMMYAQKATITVAAGTGGEPESTVDATSIKAFVADEEGNPVSGVKVALSYSDGYPFSTLTSDPEGKVSYTFDSWVTDEFTICVDDDRYNSADNVTFEVRSGKITTVGGASFTGDENITLTVREAGTDGPEEPAFDNTKLNIIAKDETGNPVKGVSFEVIGQYSSKSVAGETDDNGSLTAAVPTVFGEVSLLAQNKCGYVIKDQITLDLSYDYDYDTQAYTYYIQSVNSEAYNAPIEIVVEKAEILPDPVVRTITYSPTELSSGGGKITCTVTGEGLTRMGIANADVYCDGMFQYAIDAAVKVLDDHNCTVEFTVPANTSQTDKKYSMKLVNKSYSNINVSGASGADSYVTVKAQAADPDEPEAAEITGIEVPTSLDKTATEVEVTVNGTNLPETLWAKAITTWNDGTNDIDKSGTWAELTAAGTASRRTITVSLPTAANPVKWTVQVKPIQMTSVTDAGKATINVTESEPDLKPVVKAIDFSKTVLTSEGGEVIATLKGENLDRLQLEDKNEDGKLYEGVSGYILKAGVSAPTDIAVVTGRNAGGEPTLTYTLPANKTDMTETYMLVARINGVKFSDPDRKESINTVSVLPSDKDENAQTLGMMTITAMSGGSDEDITNAVAHVQSAVGQLKTEVKLFGTNLDRDKTMLRAVDENGIIWPVYDIPECDGVWRFIAIDGPNKDGVFGEGNSQIVELLPPRYAGTNKTYTIEASIDGKTWLDSPTVTLTIENSGISGESDFRDCSADSFKTVTVKYVDSKGKEIADAETFKGYSITMVQQFDIRAKEIEGYDLVSEPTLDEWVGNDGRVYEFSYAEKQSPDDPEKPEPKTEKISSVTLSAASYICNGKTKSPKITVKNAAGKILTEGKDYTVSGTTKAKKPGKYSITVKGTGAYTGALTRSYKITVKTTYIKSLKNGRKQFKVSAGRRSAAYVTGYQVRYSLKKNMSGAGIKTIGNKNTAVKKTVKKLKSGKYFVQVRAYKTVSGKKYYSAWSKSATVRVK